MSRPRNRCTERGFSLVEMTMAFAIFIFAALAAYALYAAGTRSFRKAESATDLQQNARTGFDQMVRELRLAGFNTNADGTPTRPDEQIEGAWDTAVSIRADFDFEDPSRNTSPETSLAGTFNIVTTGNDEIVTFALAKPAPAAGSALGFVADVGDSTRNGTDEAVALPGAVLVQDDPPYTLYRIAPMNRADLAGFDGAFDELDEFTFQAVAENIKSLNFRYYDVSGNLISPATPADGSDDIGGADATRLTRGAIARVEVSVEAMTPNPDLAWTDPDDTNPATEHYRKVLLTSTVTPRNLGKKGIQDVDLMPPSTPTGLTACVGHCGGVFLAWNPSPSTEAVSEYVVSYGPTVTSMTGTRTASANSLHIDGLDPAGTHFFSVQARDAAGNSSAFSSAISATNTENTTPGVVPDFDAAASTSTPGIVLTWTRLPENDPLVAGASGPSGCDLARPVNRDLAGYALFRDTGADPDTTDLATAYQPPATLDKNVDTWVDTNVVACQDYTYDIRALDACAVPGDNLPATATADYTTNIPPGTPTNVSASETSTTTNTVSWDPVTANADGDPVGVAGYKVYRASGPESSPPTSAGSYTFRGSTSSTSYVDTFPASSGPIIVATMSALPDPLVLAAEPAAEPEPIPVPEPGPDPDPGLPDGYAYFYRVTALDACPNESDPSAPAGALCPFDGVVSMTPANGATVYGLVAIRLQPSGTDAYVGGVVEVRDPDGNVVFGPTTDNSYPFEFSWDSRSSLPGAYTIIGAVLNDQACAKRVASRVNIVTTPACCISQLGTSLDSDNRANSNIVVRLLANLCENDLVINNIAATFAIPTGGRLDDIRWNGASVISGSNFTSPFAQDVNVAVPSSFNGGTEQTVVFDFSKSLVAGNRLDFDLRYSGSVVGEQTCSYTVILN